MGKPPYEDPDTLDLMRSDCVGLAWGAVTHDGTKLPTAEERLPAYPTGEFEVPSDAVALGELHFHLE